MIQENEFYKPPANPDQKIWRYMDFAKFAALVLDNSLFFTRADKFGDEFEGSLSIPTKDRILKHFAEEGKEHEEKHFQDIDYRPYILDDVWENYSKMGRNMREGFAISCWHMNDQESVAMWDIYSRNNGIAIQSTFKRLQECLREPGLPFIIGVVQYVDFEYEEFLDWSYFTTRYIHKRKSFDYEKELRAITWAGSRPGLPSEFPPGGIPIPLKMKDLIEKIYVSPKAPDWKFELVKKICKIQGLDMEIKHSSIADSALF